MSSEIHTYRERIASKLSDYDIYNEVLINILQLRASLEDKIDLITQAMPNLQKALTHLHYCYQNGLLSDHDYRIVLNQVLLRKTLKSEKMAKKIGLYQSGTNNIK
ncbi:MAG: hypothetical protein D6732_01185 [Methanobacteriota archaeon]|nr:MAG: hypothetical protein D6732_01185 [Euryarchaeota archaeon]